MTDKPLSSHSLETNCLLNYNQKYFADYRKCWAKISRIFNYFAYNSFGQRRHVFRLTFECYSVAKTAEQLEFETKEKFRGGVVKIVHNLYWSNYFFFQHKKEKKNKIRELFMILKIVLTSRFWKIFLLFEFLMIFFKIQNNFFLSSR